MNQQKHKLVVRIVCLVIAVLMVASLAATAFMAPVSYTHLTLPTT